MAYGIETRCIHGEDGITREHAYGSMGTPIRQQPSPIRVWGSPLDLIIQERVTLPEVNWSGL